MSSPKTEAIRAQLPPYELPPYWVPKNQRKKHPDYDNNLSQFLPRTIQLCRSTASEQLGFNIRGGKEHHYGIFVSKLCGRGHLSCDSSLYLRTAFEAMRPPATATPTLTKVMASSEPDAKGLTKGDQIISVNGINFESIEHNEAVKILKMNTTINMIVRYFPFGYDRTFDKSRYLTSLQWNNSSN